MFSFYNKVIQIKKCIVIYLMQLKSIFNNYNFTSDVTLTHILCENNISLCHDQHHVKGGGAMGAVIPDTEI